MCQNFKTSFANEMFDVFARNGEDIHVALNGAEGDKTFSEEFARAEFEVLRVETRHAFQNFCAFAHMRAFVGANEIGDVEKQRVLTLGSGLDEAIDRFEDADFAEEIDFGHGEGGVHWAAASRTGEAIPKFEGIVAGGLKRAMADFGVARFVPGNARQVVFGLEILEANVPNECAERFDGIDFIALRANETQANVFVGIFWKTGFAVGSVVIAGVLECVKTRIAQGDRASLIRFGLAAQRSGFFAARISASNAAKVREETLKMPAPASERRFVHAALDVSGNGCVGPGEHRLVIAQHAPQQPDGRRVGNLIGVVDMMTICCGERVTRDLVHADEKFGWTIRAENFFYEQVDLRVAMAVNFVESQFLFVQTFAKRARSVGVIKDVAAGFELHFELGNGKCPRAERLHEAAFEIEKAHQPPRIFFHGIFPAEMAWIAWKKIGKCARPLGGGGALVLTRSRRKSAVHGRSRLRIHARRLHEFVRYRKLHIEILIYRSSRFVFKAGHPMRSALQLALAAFAFMMPMRSAEVSGVLKQWHKVTLTFDGPTAHETNNAPNPFRDFRFSVEFRHESGAPVYRIPGYFAADGNAAETSAQSGDKWRAHLSPDKPGRWNLRAFFEQGPSAATDEKVQGQHIAPIDGSTGSF